MERMADAVRCLFSNDRYLCELLIFGQKLQTVDNNARLDTISQKQYVPITTTRKEPSSMVVRKAVAAPTCTIHMKPT
eukprot:1689769-Prymnesium_polylepis.1